jgi:hypothetical protein
LEHVIEEVISAHPHGRRRASRKLTGVKLSTHAARAAWPHILDHKWYLSGRLGRDVGLRVAAVNYFENIQSPALFEPRRARQDVPPPRLPMMLRFGERP